MSEVNRKRKKSGKTNLTPPNLRQKNDSGITQVQREDCVGLLERSVSSMSLEGEFETPEKMEDEVPFEGVEVVEDANGAPGDIEVVDNIGKEPAEVEVEADGEKEDDEVPLSEEQGPEKEKEKKPSFRQWNGEEEKDLDSSEFIDKATKRIYKFGNADCSDCFLNDMREENVILAFPANGGSFLPWMVGSIQTNWQRNITAAIGDNSYHPGTFDTVRDVVKGNWHHKRHPSFDCAAICMRWPSKIDIAVDFFNNMRQSGASPMVAIAAKDWRRATVKARFIDGITLGNIQAAEEYLRKSFTTGTDFMLHKSQFRITRIIQLKEYREASSARGRGGRGRGGRGRGNGTVALGREFVKEAHVFLQMDKKAVWLLEAQDWYLPLAGAQEVCELLSQGALEVEVADLEKKQKEYESSRKASPPSLSQALASLPGPKKSSTSAPSVASSVLSSRDKNIFKLKRQLEGKVNEDDPVTKVRRARLNKLEAEEKGEPTDELEKALDRAIKERDLAKGKDKDASEKPGVSGS